ncbi:unnamed protein product [Heligmosomoides polygyrus]|uniref:Uncharacterized protein n=1 Tax=Heligmosomoides polygyrus TaxID=6339 RepID=A0A183FJ18_HELPZ|nr:unnamed protein product [Heligmosomoides polygyrus]
MVPTQKRSLTEKQRQGPFTGWAVQARAGKNPRSWTTCVGLSQEEGDMCSEAAETKTNTTPENRQQGEERSRRDDRSLKPGGRAERQEFSDDKTPRLGSDLDASRVPSFATEKKNRREQK